jgi:hypothetical protein
VKACLNTLQTAEMAGKCEASADEKKLAGAAKNSFVSKCIKDASAAG